MTVEKEKGLSPCFDRYPIDLHLRIYPSGSTFKAELRVSGIAPRRFDISLTPQDVEDLNTGLQQEIEEVAKRCGDEGIEGSKLAKLAHAGMAAFHRIFSDGKPRQRMLEALELIEAKTDPTIEISTESFFLPWEILYNDSLHTINMDSFWGMHYTISRTIIQDDDYPGLMVPPVMRASRPIVKLIANGELNSVTEQEIPTLQLLHQEKRIALSLLRPLDQEHELQEMDYFGQFLQKNMHILHFACHAFPESPQDLSSLFISNNFKITIRDFRVREFLIKYNPFVILNACNTGVMNPLLTSSWAAVFWKYGARGVLATEFAVPDIFASSFIKELYRHILLQKPVGEALLATRRFFWEQHGNPLGLAYALYSPLAIQILPE